VGRKKSTFSILIICVVLIFASIIIFYNLEHTPAGTNFSGIVTKIVDGDTLDIDHKRIRLSLINTPEIGQSQYEEAKNFTSEICHIGSYAIIDPDDNQIPSYGRIVATVYCNGTNLNQALLNANFATIIPQFCSISEFSDESWAKQFGC